MVYESGFTTRRTYSSRPVTTSYAVTRTNQRTPIDWEKVPFVPRPSLISDPVTAFGVRRPDHERRKHSILDPINRAAIKPNYRLAYEPIEPYVSTRDKNRTRILGMVRQHIDTVEAGGNTAARTFRDSLDSQLPRLHRAVSESLPVRRETYRNEKSGAMVTKYSY
ncbi:uncharacterized protein CG45078 isoform X3 [Drosophila serrata]|uniref:uncharacterized protein CG45078 isoform X3 n=1 Tax=Drosophila serrata TaxID=7274 RepID=UPI000A1D1B6F|nr:uncharacterized protein CG45078 isoform X3 [Drosophila serrata]